METNRGVSPHKLKESIKKPTSTKKAITKKAIKKSTSSSATKKAIKKPTPSGAIKKAIKKPTSNGATTFLKRLIKERKRKGVLHKSQLSGLESQLELTKELLQRIEGVISGQFNETVHWNKELAGCKERALNPKSKTKYKQNLLETAERCDERQEKLAKAFSLVANLIGKDKQALRSKFEELERVRTGFDDFINETLDEVNKVTEFVRKDRAIQSSTDGTTVNGVTIVDPSIRNTRALETTRVLETTGEKPTHIITSMFRLYETETSGTDLKKRFKKKK